MYELLAGTTAFGKQRLKEAGYEEIRRIIRDEEPPRPSNRISTLGEHADTVAEHRRTDPLKLSRLVRGDLTDEQPLEPRWMVVWNDGARRYRAEPLSGLGFGWGVAAGDVDSDGDLDLIGAQNDRGQGEPAGYDASRCWSLHEAS